jgi:hypothetical protein
VASDKYGRMVFSAAHLVYRVYRLGRGGIRQIQRVDIPAFFLDFISLPESRTGRDYRCDWGRE